MCDEDSPLTSHLGGSTSVTGAHSCDGGRDSSGAGLGDDRGTGDLGDGGKHLGCGLVEIWECRLVLDSCNGGKQSCHGIVVWRGLIFLVLLPVVRW